LKDSMHWTEAHSETLLQPLPANPNKRLQACQDIADTIREHASWARDGGVTWRQPRHTAGPMVPGLVGPHLFPGTVGIALFLSAAGCVLEQDGLCALALHALAPLRREIREMAANPVRAAAVSHPIGGLTGLGSLVYGLTRIGDLLADSSLLDDAQAVTALITPERIAADVRLDVMLGCAGTLLALLALAEGRPEANANGSTPLDLALACARRLARSVPARSGFCHGAAGISCALARLYERTGEPWLLKAAERSLASERALYVPEARNWKISAEGEPRIFNSWCKGAPGIALGRLSLLGLTAGPLLADEISMALETTATAPLSDQDDLCCGNAGRVDILVEASRKLGDPALLSAAHHLADALLERASRNGFYSLQLQGEIVLDVRFFPGLSGIGYALLRLAAADRLPCVTAMM
jgi:lantibiotic modifying enzyme